MTRDFSVGSSGPLAHQYDKNFLAFNDGKNGEFKIKTPDFTRGQKTKRFLSLC
jgi:hypothetical protein